jgi:hypothetical protein
MSSPSRTTSSRKREMTQHACPDERATGRPRAAWLSRPGEAGISAYQTTTPFSSAQVQELETWYDSVLTWIAEQGQSYLAWDWNTGGDPYLLLDYTGTPTPGFGVTSKAHLAGL